MFNILAGRVRGITHRIEGVYNVDPPSWAIVIGIVVIIAGWYGLKFYLASRAAKESA